MNFDPVLEPILEPIFQNPCQFRKTVCNRVKWLQAVFRHINKAAIQFWMSIKKILISLRILKDNKERIYLPFSLHFDLSILTGGEHNTLKYLLRYVTINLVNIGEISP